MNATAKNFDSAIGAKGATINDGTTLCACGPGCKCGTACECQPGATCTPACKCAA